MVFGIYARKSIYTEDSDSIETQMNMCVEYIKKHYDNITDIIKYSDEGYTGANIQRPGFKLLINDVKQKKIDVLVCYKIDRISRNVVDFSKTFEELQNHNVQFVSVKEQIDTSTPLGRAMMYICSVFAQMERETIAERVKDNLLALAKSGKWPGGRPPLGFKLQKVTVNNKRHTILVENPDEIGFLNNIFNEFLAGSSLTGLETKFKNNNIKSVNGYYLSNTQIYQILSCPHYVEATKEVYDFFEKKGCIMAVEREKFDGTHGILVYGRTSGGKKKKHVDNPPEKWVVTVGLHKPLISAEKWLAVQKRFGQNKINKTRKHNIGILKGILKCKCGRTMRTKLKVDKTYNKVYTHYFCPQRMRRGAEICDTPMISIDLLDKKIIDFLKYLSVDKKRIEEYMKHDKNKQILIRSKDSIKKEILDCKRKITNLTKAIQNNNESTAIKYLITEIEKLDKQLISLEYELREAEQQEIENAKRIENIDTIYNKICKYLEDYGQLSYEDKNKYLADIIKECVLENDELKIIL